MVQPKKPQADVSNAPNKAAPLSKKEIADVKTSGKIDGRMQNGARSGFRTDSAISNSRAGQDRILQRWVPDMPEAPDGGLEKLGNSGGWDQFEANEKLFGLKTDYNENIYTTTIDKSHPQYKERMAAAERKAREIEGSIPVTAHVAEERVMDFAGGDDNGGDEEDKYSGVRRKDFPPAPPRENKYTPPAKRAPSAQATVSGAPVDPAIISSQLKSTAVKNSSTSKTEETKPIAFNRPTSPSTSAAEASKLTEKSGETKPADVKTSDKASSPLRPPASSTRTASSQVKEGGPSATSTVERDVLNSFKNFATRERTNAEKVRSNKAKADKEVKLTELKKFANTFRLSTPVPSDLIGIIAKDPAKQKEIQAKAQKNAEEMAKAKIDPAAKEKEPAYKDAPRKSSADTSAATTASETKTTARPGPVAHATSPSAVPNRHPGGRLPYPSQQYHRPNQPHMAQQARPTGNLAQRLRNVEQQKLSQQPVHHHAGVPTGPANNIDPNFRRLSHMGAKLNPNSHEFRPNAYAQPFNPNGHHPSGGSSPRQSTMTEPSTALAAPVSLIRRKVKNIDVKKCFILAHIQSSHSLVGKKTEENDGLRPSYDTPPTWRQLQEENEAAESTMRLTYVQYLDKQPFSGVTTSTSNPSHIMPQLAHQHQLPFHLQQGAMAPRQSPHITPMQMHTNQHGPAPHGPFGNGDDHRMIHSNSAQSYASPRMGQMPMAAYPPAMNSPAQVPYSQPVMQPFVPGTPQMAQFRSFSNSPQYMPQQPSHLGGPIMIQPQFMPSPQGMVAAPQMQMYPSGHPQFLPAGAAPPQSMPVSNGYPSPGRPAAPLMVHQGSQQNQQMYGMSPGVQYQQPYMPQPPTAQLNIRNYNNAGPQHFGTSPQQAHHFGPGYRSGSAGYGNKNYGNQSQHQMPPSVPVGSHGRGTENSEETK